MDQFKTSMKIDAQKSKYNVLLRSRESFITVVLKGKIILIALFICQLN